MDGVARIRRAVEWLICHPDILDAVEVCAEMESFADPVPASIDLDAAHRYLQAARLGRCAECFTQVAYWPDGRSLDFPALIHHECPDD